MKEFNVKINAKQILKIFESETISLDIVFDKDERSEFIKTHYLEILDTICKNSKTYKKVMDNSFYNLSLLLEESFFPLLIENELEEMSRQNSIKHKHVEIKDFPVLNRLMIFTERIKSCNYTNKKLVKFQTQMRSVFSKKTQELQSLSSFVYSLSSETYRHATYTNYSLVDSLSTLCGEKLTEQINYTEIDKATAKKLCFLLVDKKNCKIHNYTMLEKFLFKYPEILLEYSSALQEIRFIEDVRNVTNINSLKNIELCSEIIERFPETFIGNEQEIAQLLSLSRKLEADLKEDKALFESCCLAMDKLSKAIEKHDELNNHRIVQRTREKLLESSEIFQYIKVKNVYDDINNSVKENTKALPKIKI